MATNDALNNTLAGQTGTGKYVGDTSPTITGLVMTGVISGGNAAAGEVGEFVSSVITSGSAVGVSGASISTNVTSLALTAGDWDVTGEVWLVGTSSTRIYSREAAISTVSATIPTEPQTNSSVTSQPVSGYITTPSSLKPTLPLERARISISSTTTVYLVTRVIFGFSTLSAYGKISARRAR